MAGHSASTVRKHQAGAQHPLRSSVTPPWEQPRVCVLGGSTVIKVDRLDEPSQGQKATACQSKNPEPKAARRPGPSDSPAKPSILITLLSKV